MHHDHPQAKSSMIDDPPRPSAINKILALRFKAVGKSIRSLSRQKAVDIHQTRVDLRRAASTLQFFAPVLNQKRSEHVRRKLCSLRKALSTMRDNEILVQRSFQWTAIASTEELGEFMLDVARETVATEKKSNQSLAKSKVADVIKDMSDWQELVLKRPKTSAKSWRDLARRQLEKYLDVLQTRLDFDDLDKDALHQFRICCKNVRYQLEIIEEAGSTKLSKLIRGFRKAQEDLGELHDTLMILEYVSQAKGKGCRLSKSSLKKIITKEQTCLRKSAQAFATWWKSEGVVDRLIDWLR